MSLTDEDLTKVNNLVVTAVTEAITTLVIPRFDEHDKRFDRIEARLDNHDKRFDKIEERLGAIERDIADLKKDMREVKNHVTTIEGRLEALEADIKELYGMIEKIQQHNGDRTSFQKLPFEQKITQVYEDIRALAKEADIALPR